jgi:prophage antirepressor-like protein
VRPTARIEGGLSQKKYEVSMPNQSIAASAAPVSFSFESHAIRAVSKDGEAWFVAEDVCSVLGLTNPSMALKALDDDERSKFNLGRQGEANIINESGLYALILRSRKPEAKRFRKWVTSEVLPAIRKTGAYIHKAYKNSSRDALSAEQADSIRKALRHAVDKLPKERQMQFMISGWSKLRAHFGCKYRDIPAGEFSEALSIVARHIAEYMPAPALPAQISVIPRKQAEEINELVKEVSMLFHPFSRYASAMFGIQRLLRGRDARTMSLVKGYVDLMGDLK